MANTIRPIVRAAFKVDQLVYQFERIDVEDGLLVNGDMAEVNAEYDDAPASTTPRTNSTSPRTTCAQAGRAKTSRSISATLVSFGLS